MKLLNRLLVAVGLKKKRKPALSVLSSTLDRVRRR